MSDLAKQTIEEMLAEIKTEEDNFKNTVQKGDIVYAKKDECFSFTGFRFFTAGKGYQVIGLGINSESVICNCDIVGEQQFLNPLSITHIERDGKVIWDSRKQITFSYRTDYAETHVYDSYGTKVDPDKMYTAYIVDFMNIDEKSYGSNGFRYLVQLITPYRGGQPGDLAVLGTDYLNIYHLK